MNLDGKWLLTCDDEKWEEGDVMKCCERCNQQKEVFPHKHEICKDCCNEMLLGAPSLSFDWSQIDFEKGDFK